MSVQILRDVQTRSGRLVATRRTWVAANGHQVRVETDACVNSGSTYGDRQSKYSRVSYYCECGNEFHAKGSPKKSELANHNNWVTAEQIQQTKKAIADALEIGA
jgi:hypothetical protein